MKKITEIRKRKGISQAYMAKATGLSRYRISEFECDYRQPSAEERGLMWAVLTNKQVINVLKGKGESHGK